MVDNEGLTKYGKLRLKLSKTSSKIRKSPSNLNNWVSKHWIEYSYLKTFLFLLWFPIPVLLGILFNINVSLNILVILLIALSIIMYGFFTPLDKQRIQVIRKNPQAFIKGEKIERAVTFFELFLLSSWFVLLVLLLEVAKLANVNLIIFTGISSVIVLYASIGLVLYLVLYLYQTPSYLKRIIRLVMFFKGSNFVPKSDEYLFFPSEIEQANARFKLLSEFLEKNRFNAKIDGEFGLLRDGLDTYNDYLKERYGFVLCNTNRFYNSAKLALNSACNEEAVKRGLKDLTKQMDEKREPLEIVRTLKRMIKEPISYTDICNDLEVEPKKMRKWISEHRPEIIFTIAVPAIFEAIRNWDLILSIIKKALGL